DAFGDVRIDFVLVEHAGLFVLLEHRSVGVDAQRLDGRVLLFQIPGDAADRATGTDADDEVRDPAGGLLPDLRPGRLVVRLRVGQVVVLVRFPRVRRLAFE